MEIHMSKTVEWKLFNKSRTESRAAPPEVEGSESEGLKMDSALPSVSTSSRTQTDQDYQRIFDAYLYEYLLKRNLLTSAEIFKQEAQIGDLRSMLLTDTPGDFLFDWWSIFYESYTGRLNGLQGNQTAMFSQFGQGSSTYDLPPFPPFLRDPGPMPLVHGTDYIPQAWPTPDNSPLVYGSSGIPQVWSAHNGLPVVSSNVAIPPAWSAPNGSPLVTGAGDIPPVWWALEGALVPDTEQAPMLSVDPNLSFQSAGSSSAVVLTPWNLNFVSPAQSLQPRPPRRGIRRGSTPNDPIDVEAPMSSFASAPSGSSSSASRGPRPRRQNQPPSIGSSVLGANRMRAPTLIPPPGSMSMSQAWMAGQMAHYSRHPPFPARQSNSAFSLMANSNAASGSLLPSSLGVGGQVESFGPPLSNCQEMLASASNRNSDAQNAANGQNSKPLITGTMGLCVAGTSAVMHPSSSTQEMASQKGDNGAKTETLGQPSTPATASNPQNDQEAEINEEVSSAMKDSNMKEADEDGEEEREKDPDVGGYLNDNDGLQNGTDTSAVAPAPQPQPQLPKMQSQPSQLIELRDEAGFEFKQEACLESNLSELWCCHFSSSGKYLACAGIDRKVVVWNMGTFVCTASEEHHDDAIVDIRFKPNSPIFASASVDTTIRFWDANKPERALSRLTGHVAKVTSLDFHPSQIDLLCSCDSNQEIRFWNISNGTCLHVIKGASQQVRFQTQKGKYLAAVAGNTINILNGETLEIMHTLKGHIRPVECVCWDSSGRYLASASQESVHIWSVSSWCNSTHKLTAEGGAKFKSCIFHPGFSLVMIIGSDKNIEIWNPMENGKTLVVPAHDSYVSGLTSSICTDIIASASHDGRVKLWK